MEHIKLTTTWYLDPAILALPHPDAERLFLRGLAYCGSAETGGFIPDTALPMLGIAKAATRAAELAAVPPRALWLRVPGGWQVRSWQARQDAHDDLVTRKRADRERKARQRERERTRDLEQADLSRDNGRDLSRDRSRDVPPPIERRGEERKEEEGEDTRATPSPPPTTPPPPCRRHSNGNPDDRACRGCREHRLAQDDWDAAEPARRQAAATALQRAEYLAKAAAKQAAIDLCHLCDDTGDTPAGVWCHHPDPTVNARGSAAVRAELAARAAS